VQPLPPNKRFQKQWIGQALAGIGNPASYFIVTDCRLMI
jgi:hypothetical protein